MVIIKHQFQKFGLTKNCSFCYDGEDAINKAIGALKNGLDQNTDKNEV